MTTITVYSVAGEIGGKIIHLVDPDSKSNILFDFGRNFAAHSEFFAFPDSVKCKKGMDPGHGDDVRFNFFPRHTKS